MASQSNIKLSLTAGNYVFYERLGGYYVRSKPATIKQSNATQASGKLFGLANRLEKAFRLALLPILPKRLDKAAMRGFATALYKWLQTATHTGNEPQDNLPFITGYNWNPQALLAEKLLAPVGLQRASDRRLQIAWPAINPVTDARAPLETQMMVATLMLVACDITTAPVTATDTHEIMIPYTDTLLPAQTIYSTISTAPGVLTIATLSLHYYTGPPNAHTLVRQEDWLPVGIVGGGEWGLGKRHLRIVLIIKEIIDCRKLYAYNRSVVCNGKGQLYTNK